jgi:DnaK suppressor protein
MQNVATRNNALASLRAALIAERDRLTSKTADTLQVLAAPQNVAVEDQVSLLHEQFVALSRHSTDRHTLALVTAALNRFDRGEYGMCEECEGEISIKRLRAIPWASRCMPCQEQLESLRSRPDATLALTAFG